MEKKNLAQQIIKLKNLCQLEKIKKLLEWRKMIWEEQLWRQKMYLKDNDYKSEKCKGTSKCTIKCKQKITTNFENGKCYTRVTTNIQKCQRWLINNKN